MLHYKNLEPYFKIKIKNKKVHSILEFNQSEYTIHQL